MSPTKILAPFKQQLGNHYHPYLNHIRRVYQYACILRLEKESNLLLTAAIFHDLDIWVHQTMDYLGGSADLAIGYAKKYQKDMSVEDLKVIIERHHQLMKIKNHPDAEAFRKADLIDLSAGWVKFNIPTSIIVDTERKYPRLGFTKIVIRKSINWALKHPLKPFPMFKL